MIEIKGISKSFENKDVLTNIDLNLERGKVNMIIGKSGAGKSVLLKCLVGLFDIDSGHILYDGRPFSDMGYQKKKEIRKEIGMLFQGSALFDSKTVLENVMFPLTIFSEKSQEEIKERALFCLRRVKIEEQANNLFPAEISGGMKKRVAIARAIALQPRYLFCDEPNSGLDPQTSIVIDNLIKEITLEFDITTVVISHDMNSVMEISDFISFIHQGQKWWEGSRDDILTSENKEVVDFVYASNFMKAVRESFKKK
ncbi:MAG: ABC transporter ATP-binding protein [Flavobacteriales bacterium]|nr:ABC transporter ATP-binding protein [Flavobacteriales bacterium]|tara:strand:- start:724 stop:1488 length:765 start_codon:yes stop_codon:yes gene_type:complete